LRRYCKNRHITQKNLRISPTYLDLLYNFNRCISGDGIPNIRLAVAQGTLLWQPVKFGGCSQTAFDKGLANHKSAFKRFNGNNHATSCPNLVNFRPTISEFSLLKRAILAAIRPQFDDYLHLSRWRCKTHWKIANLISAEYHQLFLYIIKKFREIQFCSTRV